MAQVAEEIISLLASDPQAALKITVDINADYPEGASDQIKRAVSEKATSLEFGTKTFEGMQRAVGGRSSASSSICMHGN